MSAPNFAEMNETDVREHIVRPFLTSLGYAYGTAANIRTEQTFRYDRAFLGRKNQAKDPPLTGRADYILEVASYGRWVVEVKSPSEAITRDVVEQAHTYAAHPEVAAFYFLVTNGREFELYRTSRLEAPLMRWNWYDLEEVRLALVNLLGPEAIQRKARLLEPDVGKPLAAGIGSSTRIIGGRVRYEDHASNHQLLNMGQINGLELPVTGGRVDRIEDGRLHTHISIASGAHLAGLQELFGPTESFEFYASDEYISTNVERPTIFQNVYKKDIPAGQTIVVPVLGRISIPFGMNTLSETDAIGFVEGNIFKGTLELRYEISLDSIPLQIKALLEARLGRLPQRLLAQGGGRFEVEVLSQ